MKTRKIIKLINDERMNRKLSARKACDATSTDICAEFDNAACTIGSYDMCIKDFKGCTNNSNDYSCSRDYAACTNGAYDYCSTISDVYACVGPGQID